MFCVWPQPHGGEHAHLPMHQVHPGRTGRLARLSLPREQKDPGSFASMDDLREHLHRQGTPEGAGKKPKMGIVATIEFFSQARVGSHE